MNVTYRVIHHYDVWGNSDDGYEVNDSSSVGYVTVRDDVTDAGLWCALKDAYIAVGDYHDADINWNGLETVFINYAVDGKPLFTLELMEQES